MPGRPDRGDGAAPARVPFEYAVVRVVPHVEREEFVNAGIVLMSRPRRFLAARVALDEGSACARPTMNLTVSGRISGHRAYPPVTRPGRSPAYRCRSGSTGWSPLRPPSSSPRPSTGLTDDPAATLDHLFGTLVGSRTAGA